MSSKNIKGASFYQFNKASFVPEHKKVS